MSGRQERGFSGKRVFPRATVRRSPISGRDLAWRSMRLMEHGTATKPMEPRRPIQQVLGDAAQPVRG